MKNKLLLFIISNIIFLSTILNAQLLNGSFETWEESGNPTHWNTGWIFGFDKPIVPSTDAQQGNLSAKIEVVEVLGNPYSGNLQSLDSTYSFGHPLTEKYSTLIGYYKFIPKSSVILIMTIGVYDGAGMLIGVGGLNINKAEDNWTQFNIPIEYFFENQPASTILSISMVDTSESGNNSEIIGSMAYIDNLTLGNPTGIVETEFRNLSFSLEQNYPNPFNPSTKIHYSLKENGYITLTLLNGLGEEVFDIYKGYQSSGKHSVLLNGENLSSGIYFYRLQSGNNIITKKMILLR